MEVVERVVKEVEVKHHICDVCGARVEDHPCKGSFFVTYYYGHPKDGNDEWLDLCQHCSERLLDLLRSQGAHINSLEQETLD